MLRTQSNHRLLPDTERERLVGAVAAAIEAHGGVFDHPYVGVLVTVQNRGPRPR